MTTKSWSLLRHAPLFALDPTQVIVRECTQGYVEGKFLGLGYSPKHCILQIFLVN